MCMSQELETSQTMFIILYILIGFHGSTVELFSGRLPIVTLKDRRRLILIPTQNVHIIMYTQFVYNHTF